MKFVHTADWQIGMRAAHVGEASARVREERLISAERVVRLAREHEADFIVLAGDTFEDNGVDRVLVQRVVDALARFGGPVFVLPGNHDPLGPGSIWEHPAWRRAAGITVLREAKPIAVPGGELLPCPVTDKYTRRDLTAWITPAESESARGIRVGIAHGNVVSPSLPDPELPLARDAALRAGLDYLALGHWHSTGLYRDGRDAVRMAYPGTHETTSFGERDSGYALVVEIAGPGAAPKVTPIATGGLVWRVMEREVREAGDIARVRAEIEAVTRAEATLIEVRLTGLLAVSEHDELIAVADLLESRFLHGRLRAEELRPAPSDHQWLALLPAGAVREAAERLRAWSDPAFVGERPEGATPEVCAMALIELYDQVADGVGESAP